MAAPEIELPELDGKTPKMYRGGKICLTDHFKPLWARNAPKFGIAHCMALGVSLFTDFVTEKSILSHFLSVLNRMRNLNLTIRFLVIFFVFQVILVF